MPPVSELFEVREIPNAGRGVIAIQDIPADTVIFASGAPAFHVIFSEYRKETCAQCFYWDRGRSLPVRENDLGKVFCSDPCRNAWLDEQGFLGVESWRAVTAFTRQRSKSVCTSISHEGNRPDKILIEAEWRSVKKQAGLLKTSREAAGSQNVGSVTGKAAKALLQKVSQQVYPDILSYHLSGRLYRQQSPSAWDEQVRQLAMDEEPYRSHNELQAHCHSMLQLMAILPNTLATEDLVEVCSTVAQADNHNAFGINSGTSEHEKEEYMGYAVFPNASYFNHSCSPNLSKTRKGRSWEFRTTRNVSAGEELCITYLGGAEAEMNVDERRQKLEQTWGFTCGCNKCVDDTISRESIQNAW